MKRFIFSFTLLFLFYDAANSSVAQSVNGPVDFQPGTDVLRRYASPSPGPTAIKQSKQAVIGHGKAMIDTGDPKNSFWNEPVDLAGTGTVVNSDMLWDASSKILYFFAHTTLRCTHGKPVEGDILMGIYGKRNFLNRSPGSGWWVANLSADQCEIAVPGLYGCKFDAQGNILACGRAELDTRINDMAIVESSRY